MYWYPYYYSVYAPTHFIKTIKIKRAGLLLLILKHFHTITRRLGPLRKLNIRQQYFITYIPVTVIKLQHFYFLFYGRHYKIC